MAAQQISTVCAITPQKIAVVCLDSRRMGVEEQRWQLDAALDCVQSLNQRVHVQGTDLHQISPNFTAEQLQ